MPFQAMGIMKRYSSLHQVYDTILFLIESIPILFKFRVGLPDGKDEDIQDTDHPNNYIFGSSWMWERPAQSVQLICGITLTFIKAYDLACSDEIPRVLAMKDDPLRFAWGVLCLLCQTAIFPTIFDAVLVCLEPSDKAVGMSYSILSFSAELHLFGPIMAISASLDDDDLDNYEEPDSPLQKGGFDVADETKKHLPFESTDMRSPTYRC
ncbi:hypothetical protein PCANC_23640 [Puccinia coronata f. sp. avenae]|uniref:Uncharacterized protein n=1 Tax=Puccinia coronata f. sp. avenae TaxID=200324 RepID=A0A2N5U756_9BASI|nr:hypothetical protein PCANC_23640 [Puccinia coronata f. sp. avenae]